VTEYQSAEDKITTLERQVALDQEAIRILQETSIAYAKRAGTILRELERQVNDERESARTFSAQCIAQENTIRELRVTQSRSGEVEWPCGHTVAHEENCPRCEIERLRSQSDASAEPRL